MNSVTSFSTGDDAAADSDSSPVTAVQTEQSQIGGRPVGGYPEMAKYMAQHPDMSVFRRFAAIGMEVLLYLQAQLASLEERLRKVQEEDSELGIAHGKSWDLLEASSKLEAGDPGRRQYDLIMEITEKKIQYDNALVLYRDNLSLRRPNNKLLSDLRGWMGYSRGNIRIIDRDRQTWLPNAELNNDLLTFEDSIMDRLTRFIVFTLIDIFHKCWRLVHWRKIEEMEKKYEEEVNSPNNILPLSNMDLCPTKTYSYKAIETFTRTLTVLMACLLPIGSILILHSVQETTKRLGIVAALMGLFSVSMNLLTMATLSEIFQATSAFAAVLVVFIGTTSGTTAGMPG